MQDYFTITDKFLRRLLIFSLSILFFSLGLFWGYNLQEIKQFGSSFNQLNSNCTSSNDLWQTGLCLKEELEPHYKYNLSNLDITLSEQELYQSGGVCWHYSDWYTAKLKDSSYTTQKVTIKTGNNTHQFVIMSDSTGYCLLDQLEVHCIYLG